MKKRENILFVAKLTQNADRIVTRFGGVRGRRAGALNVERFTFEKGKRETAACAARPEVSGKIAFFRETTGHMV